MTHIRQRLGWKLFFSYLIIIVVGAVSLAIAAEFATPAAFNRHIATMETMMGSNMSGMMSDLTTSFQAAINEILLIASTLAVITAVFVSSFVTRRIVRPVQAMTQASQRIANGRYDERVAVVGEDELADLADSFNQMAQELAQTEERRLQLIGDVAHELRTPLSSIKGVMEGLVDGVLPADHATFLNVEREVSRLQRLVQDLEQLSKAEAGQLALEFSWVSPAVFVDAAVDRLALQYEDKEVTLRNILPPDLPAIYADEARLTQVMLNLLGNSLQYTPAGGEVVVSTEVVDQSLQLAVKDTGIGLAAAVLPHIFERFYRVDQSRARNSGGSGIGLTI
ncbi:MAG: HAMP domain-containing protein, partial [Anaerolineales bacterium]|nr:HAMP domain-containing protein [Anaerolineales bacterium]